MDCVWVLEAGTFLGNHLIGNGKSFDKWVLFLKSMFSHILRLILLSIVLYYIRHFRVFILLFWVFQPQKYLWIVIEIKFIRAMFNKPQMNEARIMFPNDINPSSAYGRNKSFESNNFDTNREKRLNARTIQDLTNENDNLRYQSNTIDKTNDYGTGNLDKHPNKEYQTSMNSRRSINKLIEPNEYDASSRYQTRLKSKRIELNSGHEKINSHRSSSTMSPVLKYAANRSFEMAPNSIKRHLPVFEKEKVFNEWAAVIKHQDEIDREMRLLQAQKQRERQIKYKQDLDEQYNEFMSKKKGSLSSELKKEEELLNQQIKVQTEKDSKADKIKREKIQNLKDTAINAIYEQREKKRQDDMMKQFEVERQKKFIYEENKILSRQK